MKEDGYEEVKKGNILFGTIDSWLIWNLTRNKIRAIDYSNVWLILFYAKIFWLN
ncbi:hypothetical protein [Thermosipho atlanticus]|uniref:hypothetical protein n=1 Tax=Thermosipho atlanticus TaxID=238991 RepID=UPI00135662B0|nr:hypothetical protein [Thermosipho atlanticus]